MTDKPVEELDTPFPSALVKKNPQGFDYVPAAEVVARMNRVLGYERWDVEIISTAAWGACDTFAGPMPSHVTAHVRVYITETNGRRSFKDGMGGQEVNYYRDRNKGPVNLGDSFKGACSDAMKKALSHDGVALELARKDEALRYERQLSGEEEPANAYSGSEGGERLCPACNNPLGTEPLVRNPTGAGFIHRHCPDASPAPNDLGGWESLDERNLWHVNYITDYKDLHEPEREALKIVAHRIGLASFPRSFAADRRQAAELDEAYEELVRVGR